MITRKQYMAGEATHREYYGQFVDLAVKEIVLSHIGIETLRSSTDEHLNDIPLGHWDGVSDHLRRTYICRKIAEANGGGVSLSDGVCVAKEAARQLLEEETRDA